MKKFLLYLFMGCTVFALLSLTTNSDNKKKTLVAKQKMATPGFEHKLTRILNLETRNGPKISFNTQFYTKSTIEEDSIPAWKLDFEYLNEQIITTQADWDTVNNRWIPTFKDVMFFRQDAQNTDSVHFYEIDSLTGTWKLTTRILTFYDNLEHLTEELMYMLNDTTDAWDKMSKSVFETNNNGNITSEWYYYWPPNDTGWALSTLYENTYDGDLKMQTEMSTYNPFFGTWSPFFRTTLDYDNLNRLIMRLEEMWDFFEMKYNIVTKEIYTYIDDTDNTDTLVWLRYNHDQGSYAVNWYEKYNYNSLNNLLVSIDNYSKYMEEDKSANDEQDFVKSDVTLYFFEESDGGDGDGGNGGDPTLTEQNEFQTTLVYPNPVKNQLLVQIPSSENCSLDIFTLEGKLILSKQLYSKNTAINTENFEKGTYILRINNSGKRIIKKIVKQ